MKKKFYKCEHPICLETTFGKDIFEKGCQLLIYFYFLKPVN